MRRDGSVGRPLLAEVAYEVDPNWEDRATYIAWTGSHRRAAARRLRREIPIHVVDSTALEVVAGAKRDAWFNPEVRRQLSARTLEWLGREVPEGYGCAVHYDDRSRLELLQRA